MKDSSLQWDSVSSDIVSKHDFFFFFFFFLWIFSQIPDDGEKKRKDRFPIQEVSILHFYHEDRRVSANLWRFFFFFFFFQRDEPRWRRRRDKSTRLDRENGIEERRVSFVFARVLILARVTLDAIRSRLKRDRAVLATVLDVIKSALESGFRSRYVVIVRNRHQDMSRCFN